jgi:alpha-ketoglutarate-dependent taurine dioxygenase
MSIMAPSATAMPYLDLHRGVDSPRLDHIITDRRAWTRETVTARDWTVPLDGAALTEIRELAATLARDPLPTLLLDPGQFRLDAARAAMTRAKSLLTEVIGVALVDRLPLDEVGLEHGVAAYWVLSQFLGTLVAQKWDGTMLYDVRDTGRAYGYGVRGSWTNIELSFHTDNAFAVAPPDYVGLLCLQPARRGGVSRFISLYSVHNRMLERHPAALARLYQPMFMDRQAEHAPDAPKVSWVPMFRWDGQRLRARLSAGLVRKGYALMEITPPADVQEALTALSEVLDDPALAIEFTVARGQIQLLNNRAFGHYRSTFEDDPAAPRHLVRLWVREQGRRSYDG